MAKNDDDVYDFAGGPAPPLPSHRGHSVQVTRPVAAPQYVPPGGFRRPPPPPDPAERKRKLLIGGGIALASFVVFGVLAKAIVSGVRGKPAPVQTVQIERAAFPARPQMKRVARGVRFCEVTLRGKGPGQAMKVWVYLPEGQHAPASLPCVFIAPAGSTLITGMALGDGDRPEHLPWVQEGFAVVSYELDGDVPGDLKRVSNATFAAAARKFMNAEGGIANAKTAIEYVLAKVPEVDPARLYCAGHSSAATLALQLASKEPRMKACVAFAPATDIIARHGTLNVRDLDRVAPGAKRFLTDYSPKNLPTPQCPVFLFHANDDSNVPCDQSRAYAEARGERVKLVVVPSGDHYDSMTEAGIPAAIEWLKPMAGVKAKPEAPKRRAAPAPQPDAPAEEPAAQEPAAGPQP